MGRDKFKEGLEELKCIVELKDTDKVIVVYKIEEGRFQDREVKLGVVVPQDFEMTPPSGIHISPRLIPMNPSALDHSRAADSPFGSDWQYLSRPFADQWPLKRTVKRYMEYVKYLLDTL